jgi:spermidine synthase
MILLEELDTECGNIRIVRSKGDGACSYYQGLCLHSQINEDGVSMCGYVHVMYSVIRQSQALRVLMIGCAGGTLGTMLHRLGCKVTVVDINPHAFTLARKHFGMPADITCVVDDGWSYLLKTGRRYDAIAIDAFSGDGSIADEFTGEDCFRIVKEVLDPSGVVVMNVLPEHDLDMLGDRVASNMESAGLPSVIFDRPGKGGRNVVVAGGAVGHIQIVSFRKPACVRQELHGIIRRNAKKQAGSNRMSP